MLEVTIVTHNKADIDRIIKSGLDGFCLNDLDPIKEKSKAWKLKSEWGARLDPFIKVDDEDKTVKCFYSEEEKDTIGEFLNYLKNVEC